ncbi:helix-turn-helix domain-containing protein [Streptomyces iakyrus]
MGEVVDGERESGRAALGRTLRFLRGQAGKSLGQLAEDTGYDKSYLSRLEKGERLSKLAVMEDLDSYYGCGDLLVREWREARREVIKDKSGAQTTAGNTEEVEEQVAARMGRQELLYRESAPDVRVILDEVALRRPVPDTKVWAEQLSHLLDAAELPNVAIQVLPFAAGVHDLMDSHLWLFWQRVGDPVAWTEGNGFGELITEVDKVLRFRLSYDRVRDAALTPVESTAFIKRLLEECRE